MDAQSQPLALYPIRTIAALCGVDTATLRNWELRYHLLRPHRDRQGHRFYSEADLDRIRRIIALLDSGVPILHVAATLAGTRTKPHAFEQRRGAWEQLRGELRSAIAAFDDHALHAAYAQALATYPMRCVLRHALLPLLHTLGERWRDETGAVAEEHFFTFFLRNKLGARFHHQMLKNHGPKLLAACMPGEQHEIGLLLLALSASERGYRVCVLGADTPLTDTAFAAQRADVNAVVLSTSMEPGPAILKELLPSFVDSLRMPVFVGGAMSPDNRERYEALGIVVLGDDEPEQALERIGQRLTRGL